MIRYGALAFFLVVLSANAQEAPQWEVLESSPTNNYRIEDIDFIDADNGWAVIGSGGGKVYRTTNRGDNWTLMSSPEGYLRSVGFANSQKGWAGALFSTAQLYETNDGGATMVDVTDRIQPAIGGGLCGIWVVNEHVAYGVGEYDGPAYVIKTTNGGQSWQSTDLSAMVSTLVDVFFFDEMNGIAVGGIGDIGSGDIVPRIIGTDDGGATWAIRHTADSIERAWGWKFSFPTSQIGYVSIEFWDSVVDGYLLKTSNGGESWSEVPIPGGGSLQGAGFVTPEIGWTSGRGQASVTTDGGASWEQITFDENINRFQFLGDSLGFAVGHRIYRLGPISVSNEGIPDVASDGLHSVFPNPSRSAFTIVYDLDQPSDVRMVIFDVLGRQVETIDIGPRPAGTAYATWDPSSSRLPTGNYILRLEAGHRMWDRRVTIVQ